MNLAAINSLSIEKFSGCSYVEYRDADASKGEEAMTKRLWIGGSRFGDQYSEYKI